MYHKICFHGEIRKLSVFSAEKCLIRNNESTDNIRIKHGFSCINIQQVEPPASASWTSNVCSEMTGQWSDRSAMSGRKKLSPPGPMSYLCGLALDSGPHSEGEKTPVVWTCGTLQWCSKDSLSHTGWGKAWAWEAQDDMDCGIAQSGSFRLSTLMIDVPGDLVWDLSCVQQASYLEGGPLTWM